MFRGMGVQRTARYRKGPQESARQVLRRADAVLTALHRTESVESHSVRLANLLDHGAVIPHRINPKSAGG